MSSSRKWLAMLLAAAITLPALAQQRFAGVGRAATPAEVKAWDIDVRPDFQGLPAGSGSVDQGQDVWESRCASCHGFFGESNSVFFPLIGGTGKDDVKSGRVANLSRLDYPQRTTLMKVPTVSTLWDYINRAMPWDKPKSLQPDEVYAVTAFLLHLADVLPADFTLSNRNIAEVQQRMPNRNGMTTKHAMWPGPELGGTPGKPDVQATACMKDCTPELKVSSVLPAHARDAHGNLREQNRTVGPQRGSDTTREEGLLGDAAGPVAVPDADKVAGAVPPAVALTQQHGCTACHAQASKLVGPSFVDIGKKHGGKADYIAGKIKAGGSGVWGETPMPPQDLPAADVQVMAEWLAAGAAAK
ncbi:MAG TPA: c-type cytochrome [Ottowia sp.]|uniref:c-type cytochrome n=1 Tax=Ottowia sp. TaxID=1898956 RepID=UPI002B55E26A|nr:c-type cytochrome [Ottowia sp.]HMN19783.1 c-type cytochrome [Ottowia sp.]